MKKTYKPKDEKIAKLMKIHSQIKIEKPIKCELFTKAAKLIALVVLMTSCSAQWHLKRAVKKDPSILFERVVTMIDTIIVRDSVIKKDTFIMRKIDTAIVETEKFKTIVYRHHDTFRVETKIKGDTIRITKKIALPPMIKYINYPKWPIYLAVMAFILGVCSVLLKNKKHVK